MTDDRIVIQHTDIELSKLVCYSRAAAGDGGPPLWTVTDNLRGPRDIDIAPAAWSSPAMRW